MVRVVHPPPRRTRIIGLSMHVGPNLNLLWLGQNVSGQNGTGKMVWTKWYTDKMLLDKMVRTIWYGLNGTEKIINLSIPFPLTI